MNIEYRKATLDDILELVNARIEFTNEISEITNEDVILLGETNNKYFTESIANGSYASFIGLSDGRIVGTSGITFYTVPPNKKCPNGKIAYISNMFTRKEYRGMGIASTLFASIVQEAKDLGYEKIILNATEMGRPLYEKFGFTATQGDMEYIIK